MKVFSSIGVMALCAYNFDMRPDVDPMQFCPNGLCSIGLAFSGGYLIMTLIEMFKHKPKY